MVQLERLTMRERITVQKQVLKGGVTLFTVWRNDDGTWACDVSGLVFEAHSFGDLCRELAAIAETV